MRCLYRIQPGNRSYGAPNYYERDERKMERMFQQILQELKILNGRFSNIESEITTIKSDVATLKSQMANLEAQVTSLQTQVTNLNDRVTNLETQVHKLDDRVANIEANMATKADVADIPAIKLAVLEVSERLNEMISSQERQDRILESLSIRSIEQESELRALKRIK